MLGINFIRSTFTGMVSSQNRAPLSHFGLFCFFYIFMIYVIKFQFKTSFDHTHGRFGPLLGRLLVFNLILSILRGSGVRQNRAPLSHFGLFCLFYIFIIYVSKFDKQISFDDTYGRFGPLLGCLFVFKLFLSILRGKGDRQNLAPLSHFGPFCLFHLFICYISKYPFKTSFVQFR